MSGLVVAISYWLHLIATSVWIGGIIFVLFIAIPSSKNVLGADAGKLMGEVSKRFTTLANYSIALLVISGVVLMGLSKQLSGIWTPNSWTTILILKHVLVLGMIIVHFYRGLFLAPKIMKTISATEKATLQKLSLNLVKVNFSMGIVVLLPSGMASALDLK